MFPSVQSRNSHMRIHKANMTPVMPTQNHKFALPKQVIQRNNQEMYQNIVVKQEPNSMEPEVQLYEPEQKQQANISIIPNRKSQKPLNPDIMRLVQNNPSISIRTMENRSSTPPAPAPVQRRVVNLNNSAPAATLAPSPNMVSSEDSGKIYKCSSCSKPFNNKSNLYFHKKNQCGGSRYPCPFCKKRFGTESDYSSHIYYSHPE